MNAVIDQEKTQLQSAVATKTIPEPTQINAFANLDGFELAQRMAKMLAASQLVPTAFQGNIPNCMIALEMASRLGASPLSVAQNLYVVHGNPSWSAQYVIAAVNSSGKFQPLRFKLAGEGDDRSCIAWTRDSTGEVLEGPAVSIAMAKAEGWHGKKGSKWQTMPELMLRYRSATFFGRLYAPELMMGMKTVDEIHDLNTVDQAGNVIEDVTTTQALNESIKAKPARKPTKKQAKPEPEPQDKPEPSGYEEKPAHTPDQSLQALSQCRNDMSAATTIDDLDLAADAGQEGITNQIHKDLIKEHYNICVLKLEGKE